MKTNVTSKKFLFWIFLPSFLFFLLITFLGNEGLIELKKLYSLRNQIRKENFGLYQSNRALNQEILLLQEPSHLQQLIREKFGYLKPEEYLLILDHSDQSSSH